MIFNTSSAPEDVAQENRKSHARPGNGGFVTLWLLFKYVAAVFSALSISAVEVGVVAFVAIAVIGALREAAKRYGYRYGVHRQVNWARVHGRHRVRSAWRASYTAVGWFGGRKEPATRAAAWPSWRTAESS